MDQAHRAFASLGALPIKTKHSAEQRERAWEIATEFQFPTAAQAQRWAAYDMNLKVLFIVVFLLAASCEKKNALSSKAQVSPQTNVNVNLNEASESELLNHVGETVTMHGKWSLRGKIGPYILVANGPIYVVSHGSYSWDEKYSRMEGKDVRVTGVLRYAHSTAASGRPSSEQHIFDHFYFEAETAKIELN